MKNNKCKVYTYYEDFYDTQEEGVTINQIVNRQILFGGLSPNKACTESYWVIKKSKKCDAIGLVLTKETKSYTPQSEKVVRFNIIGFEIARTQYHTTTFDIVFVNGWHKQYFAVCCEKFASSTPESYKIQIFNSLSGIGQPCTSKYQQYCENFVNKQYTQLVKFSPSFALIVCLIESVAYQPESQLSLTQIECLFTLCNQIPLLTKENLEEIVEQLEVFSKKYSTNPDLFSALQDRWNDSDNSILVFKSWAFFPFQKVVQPFLFNPELVKDSPHFLRYLISCKYGNLFAGQILSQLYETQDDEEGDLHRLAKQYGVPTDNSISKSIEQFPHILLRRNRKYRMSNVQDPRLWYFCPTNDFNYSLQDFKHYLFGLDWYLLSLFVLGLRFKEHAEYVKSVLKEHNIGLYYHFVRQLGGTTSERVELSKKAIAHGIHEDISLINLSAEEHDRVLWGCLSTLFEEKNIGKLTINK